MKRGREKVDTGSLIRLGKFYKDAVLGSRELRVDEVLVSGASYIMTHSLNGIHSIHSESLGFISIYICSTSREKSSRSMSPMR